MRAIALLLLVACASSPRAVPEAPPAIPETRAAPTPVLNPVGEFEWSSALGDGTPIKGTFTITGSPDAYTGAINATDLGIFPIKNVGVSGQSIVINAEHPDGPLTIRLNFTGETFNGAWLLGTETGEMVGKRLK